MSDEIIERRKDRRKRIAQRRRLRDDREETEKKISIRAELFMKIGIFAVLAFIPVDFFIRFYPFIGGNLSMEMASTAYLFMEVLGILFGIGLYYAGKKLIRDSGVYGGMFQINASIIGIIGISLFLIVNPLLYTQTDLIVNSIYYGMNIVASITLLIFSLLIGAFFLLTGSSYQKQPIKYVIMITGLLWFAQLFLPVFTPSPADDFTLYSIISGFSWFVYIFTAFCFWKMIVDEDIIPTAGTPYKIK